MIRDFLRYHRDNIIKYGLRGSIFLFGGLFVGWLGFIIVQAPLREAATDHADKESLLHGLTSAFLLTISNPITLIVFAAAFTAMGITLTEHSLTQGLVLTGGVFFGAIGWWISLTTVVHVLRHQLSDQTLLWINRISGALLLCFSGYILLDLVGFVRL